VPDITPPTEFATPEARLQWVFAQRERGCTLRDLAKVLGVSERRVGQMSRKGARLSNPSLHWHTGLSSRTANRLVERGFASREEVEAAVKKGVITDRPTASQKELFVSAAQRTTVPGLGRAGFNELREWLGLEANPQEGGR